MKWECDDYVVNQSYKRVFLTIMWVAYKKRRLTLSGQRLRLHNLMSCPVTAERITMHMFLLTTGIRLLAKLLIYWDKFTLSLCCYLRLVLRFFCVVVSAS